MVLYGTKRPRKKGILDPKLSEEKIILISFDADGKVGAVTQQQSGREDIPLVQRTTPVSGNDYTFLQQMIGNVGKFNKQPQSAIETSSGGL
jgi:outer membrane protein assembly factor BamE (lipoprotein component of BamABCDE complex)